MMGLAAGDLDRRIRIERATLTRDEANEPVPGWAELTTVWAAIEEVSDGERIRAKGVAADVTNRFTIRYSSVVADLGPKDRIVYKGRVYDISRVKEIGRREGLEITAAARGDQG